MKRTAAVWPFAFIMFFSAGLFGQGEECGKKCVDEFTQCGNRCRVMAGDNAGCEERCVTQKDRCAAACASASPGASADDLDNEGMEEDLDGGDVNDLEELEELEYNFDGVDGLPENGWGDLNDLNDWNIGD